MADFNEAVNLTLQHEGGYVDNPNDPGGATNMGVEQRDLPGAPIQTLTVDEATAYYSETYWKPLYGQINSQAVANKLFDFGVLFGIGTAVKVLQRVLGVLADGSFGPLTLAAVNTSDEGTLAENYENAMYQHAVNVTLSNIRESIFLAGWKRRIYS